MCTVVVEKIDLDAPIDLSLLVEALNLPEGSDLSAMSDTEYARFQAVYAALCIKMDRLAAAEQQRGRCFMYCAQCGVIEILEDPDQLPSHWYARTFVSAKPHRTFVHHVCGSETGRPE